MKNIGHYVYLEFLFQVNDYFETLKLKECVFDWGVPAALSLLFFWAFHDKLRVEYIGEFVGYVINILAILIGFTITSLTILATGNNQTIAELKAFITKRRIGGRKISLYKLTYITFSFNLLMETLLLLGSLLFFMVIKFGANEKILKWLFLPYGIILLQIIFLNIRNITNFYFTVRRENRDKK